MVLPSSSDLRLTSDVPTRRLLRALAVGSVLLALASLLSGYRSPGTPKAESGDQASPSLRIYGPKHPIYRHYPFEQYAAVLKGAVNDGLVDYELLSRDHEALDEFLLQLAKTNPDYFGTRKEELVFWINAFNAFTLKGVLDRYPVETVMSPAKDFWQRRIYNIGGSRYSLLDIEYRIVDGIRDARAIFGLTCTGIDCPHLRAMPYSSASIEQELDSRIELFLQNGSVFRIDREEKRVYLSECFSWLRRAFERQKGSTVRFLMDYLPPADRRFLEENEVEVVYLAHDWTLNDRLNEGARRSSRREPFDPKLLGQALQKGRGPAPPRLLAAPKNPY